MEFYLTSQCMAWLTRVSRKLSDEDVIFLVGLGSHEPESMKIYFVCVHWILDSAEENTVGKTAVRRAPAIFGPNRAGWFN